MEPARPDTNVDFLDALGSGMLSEDAEGVVIQANPAVCSIVGIEPATLDLVGMAGRAVDEVLARRYLDPEAYLRASEQLRVRRTFSLAPTVLETRGGTFVGRGFHPVVVGGEYRGCVWMFTDVSRYAELDRQVVEAKADLEDAHRQLEAFVVAAAHELRTPLTAALTHVELVTDPVAEALTAEQRANLGAAERGLRRMGIVIEELLTLGRLRRSSSAAGDDEVDVATVVEWVAADEEPFAARAGVTLSTQVGAGPPLRADPTLIHQALRNLVDNSLASITSGGSVSLEASFVEGAWRIEVVDTGVGLVVADHSALFDPYARAEAVLAGERRGTGLGLPLVKAIVDLYGGTVALESELGVGTKVVLTFPEAVGDPSPDGTAAS